MPYVIVLLLTAAAPGCTAAAETLAPAALSLELGAPAPPVPSDVRLGDPSSPDTGARAAARRPSWLASGAGFLLGDALALGIIGLGNVVARSAGEDAYLGYAVLSYEYAAIAAIVVPPVLGTYLGAGGAGVPGTRRAFLVSGAVHLAALVGAAVLADRDARWAAAGLMVAVDVGVAPWIVTRTVHPTSGEADDAISGARAVPASDPALRR